VERLETADKDALFFDVLRKFTRHNILF